MNQLLGKVEQKIDFAPLFLKIEINCFAPLFLKVEKLNMSKSAFETIAEKSAENNFSISCTFGPVAENGTGKNQKIGKDLEKGLTKEELIKAKN